MTHHLTIEYDEDVLKALQQSAEDFNKEAPFLLAAVLYSTGRISSGKAAQFCGMNRVQFLLALPAIGLPVSNLRPEDVEQELKFARG
jgi:predicted HTH domain antitoxin